MPYFAFKRPSRAFIFSNTIYHPDIKNAYTRKYSAQKRQASDFSLFQVAIIRKYATMIHVYNYAIMSFSNSGRERRYSPKRQNRHFSSQGVRRGKRDRRKSIKYLFLRFPGGQKNFFKSLSAYIGKFRIKPFLRSYEIQNKNLFLCSSAIAKNRFLFCSVSAAISSFLPGYFLFLP